MPRDASGLYQLPANTTAVPGTLIESEKFNTFINDVASELTASLPRDGRAPMTDKLQLASGNAASPAAQFTASAQTGFYYDTVGGAIVFVVAGVEVGRVTANGITGAKPVGEIFDFAGASAPTGALLCGGQAVSRTTYARLFTICGTTYGVGDGSTTFNVPDLRGVVRAGLDNLGGSDAGRMSTYANHNTLGGIGGTQNHTLTAGQIPIIVPTGIVNVSYPAHQYKRYANGSVQLQGGINATLPTSDLDANTVPPGNVNHAVAMDQIGGGQAHPNAQPTRFLTTCIQAL
jgi:microcystin-dependent protein